MIIKLYLPFDWDKKTRDCWFEWLKARIEEKEDLLLRHVEKIETNYEEENHGNKKFTGKDRGNDSTTFCKP